MAKKKKEKPAASLPEKEILKSGRVDLVKSKEDFEQHAKFDKFKKGTK